MVYLSRYIEEEITRALETAGVVVTGPKFCGKTTKSKLFAKSSYTLDTKRKIELVESNPVGQRHSRRADHDAQRLALGQGHLPADRCAYKKALVRGIPRGRAPMRKSGTRGARPFGNGLPPR